MNNNKTTFIVLEINSKDDKFDEELKRKWLDALSSYSNGKVSVDGIISERKAPCVLNLEGAEYKTAIEEQIKTLSLIRKGVKRFENSICLDE